MHSLAAGVTLDAVDVAILDVLTQLALKSDGTVPDSPVHEIDHPRQLS